MDKTITYNILLFIIGTFIMTFILVFYIQTKIRTKKVDKSISKKNWTPDNKNQYFRNIPFDDLEIAFWVAIHYQIVDDPSNLMNALLLKWIREDKIDVINDGHQTIIDFNKIFKTEPGFESEFYISLLISASSNQDRLLGEREFQRFFENYEDHLIKLFSKMDKEVQKKLIKQNLISIQKDKQNHSVIVESPALDEKANQLLGLKNFLNDFSSVDEKTPKEVHLWEDYLIYAALFGISDKVAKTLETVLPDIDQMIKFSSAKVGLVSALAATAKITFILLLGGIVANNNND